MWFYWHTKSHPKRRGTKGTYRLPSLMKPSRGRHLQESEVYHLLYYRSKIKERFDLAYKSEHLSSGQRLVELKKFEATMYGEETAEVKAAVAAKLEELSDALERTREQNAEAAIATERTPEQYKM